jgi:hypothetical protein
MRRRDFITLLGGAAAWPLAARAQQPDGMRRIAALIDTDESNSDGQTRVAALRQTLQQLGWTEGRNIQIDLRWGGGDVERTRGFAAELVRLAPDVIFAYACAARARDPHDPYRFLRCFGSDRGRLHRELCAPGRQYHGIYAVRAVDGRQVVGGAEGDCTRPRPGGHCR